MKNSVTTLPDEQTLVANALADPAAFADLYDHYVPRIYTYIRYRVDDRTTAEDLTAQTFEQALNTLKNYQPGRAPFIAWLFGIAHNVVSRHHRIQQRQRFLSLDVLVSHKSDHRTPEDAVIQHETHNELVCAVAKLHDHERNLIALKFAAGLNNRQIAEISGLSESNVGVILYRSIQQLRGFLSE